MNITDKNTLKSWFLRGMKPLESQFAAWIDAYWHKSEQIPTSSINGLEITLNSKAEAADVKNLTDEFATHSDDNTRHKTPEEQAKLGNLADNANLTYATKEEISILQDNGAIVIPIDFTKVRKEREQEAQNVWSEYLPNYAGKPFYILFKWFESAGSTKILTELALCKQPRIYNDDSESLTEAEATLALPILTQEDILAGKTTPKSRRIKLFVDSEEIYVSEIQFDKIVPIKSFNLYFFPEGKFAWDWPEYCEANAGQEVSGTLTRYGNESVFACDKWDDLYTFMKYDKVNENRIPPIYLSTITSGQKELFKPAIIEARTTIIGGARNEIAGFKLRTCSLEEINGKKCLLEETLNIPIFTGYGSPYTYKFTITPCDDATLHKTPEEQAKLDNLADNANTTYATKEEISILQSNGAIVIPYDFTKTEAERLAEAQRVFQESTASGSVNQKPFYFLFKYFASSSMTMIKTELVYCTQPAINSSTNFTQRVMLDGMLSSKILTYDEIIAGETESFMRKVSLQLFEDEWYLDESKYTPAVKMKSFNLYFMPEGKYPSNWPEYCTANQGVEVSGILTSTYNESLVICDKWDAMHTFMKFDNVNENRIPPICLRTITSGEKDLFKPAIIEVYGACVAAGKRNNIHGFKLQTSNIEEINGEKCLVEETLDIPSFTGYGSAYTYKFTITPCKPKVEVVTEYPTDLSGVADGTIFIKNPVV